MLLEVLCLIYPPLEVTAARGSWLALRGCTGEFGGSCDFSQVFFHQPVSGVIAGVIFCISGSLPLMRNC
ncbi:hypothetical protein Pelo_4391 [Pelomyxa schiedti]|nr:hypothetical protein Pelo_4391 [Pelomyxa schiedti]